MKSLIAKLRYQPYWDEKLFLLSNKFRSSKHEEDEWDQDCGISLEQKTLDLFSKL